jgi:hypothetical protein
MKRNPQSSLRHLRECDQTGTKNRHNQPADEELLPSLDPDEPTDLDEIDPDDERWDAFLADDDELDPTPEPGDFWPEND